ncbi:pyrimidine and pyridine-specific 5'-nucleotidase [Anaerolineales bacterium]|nr:pyrimidine and pyridine-specific 5'-nucleotidase [Anaerolineales bacterium]
MRFTTIFFDLDDTLYPSHVGLWSAIKARMNDYMSQHMNIPIGEIPKLREKYYLQYGTTLHGLQKHHNVDVQDYLAYVHDLPLADYLTPDPVLRSIIASLPTRNLIFTNADAAHAERVLATLNLRDLFTAIVDVNAIDPYCKPMPESFGIAMKTAGETDPSHCVMIDDLGRTTRAAKQAGLSSILYGGMAVNGDADASLSDWNELVGILENLSALSGA